MARVDYRTYIESDEWKFKAKAMKWIAGNRCQVCNSSDKRLDTHHRTYDNLGNETPQDLVVLCSNCHGLYHQNDKGHKSRKVTYPVSYYLDLKGTDVIGLDTLSEIEEGAIIDVAGIITHLYKNEYLKIQDTYSEIDVVIPGEVRSTCEHSLVEGNGVFIRGSKCTTSRKIDYIKADFITHKKSAYLIRKQLLNGH